MAGAQKKPEVRKGFVVVAPLVQAKVSGRVLHFYKGDVLPEGAAQESIDNLLQLGYIADSASESDEN